MNMLDKVRVWRGRVAVDRDGKRIGEVVEILVDDRSDEPWALVDTGSFEGRLSIAPLRGASPRGAELRLPSSRRRVLDAPNVAPGTTLDAAAERRAFGHYGINYDMPGAPRVAA